MGLRPGFPGETNVMCNHGSLYIEEGRGREGNTADGAVVKADQLLLLVLRMEEESQGNGFSSRALPSGKDYMKVLSILTSLGKTVRLVGGFFKL